MVSMRWTGDPVSDKARLIGIVDESAHVRQR